MGSNSGAKSIAQQRKAQQGAAGPGEGATEEAVRSRTGRRALQEQHAGGRGEGQHESHMFFGKPAWQQHRQAVPSTIQVVEPPTAEWRRIFPESRDGKRQWRHFVDVAVQVKGGRAYRIGVLHTVSGSSKKGQEDHRIPSGAGGVRLKQDCMRAVLEQLLDPAPCSTAGAHPEVALMGDVNLSRGEVFEVLSQVGGEDKRWEVDHVVVRQGSRETGGDVIVSRCHKTMRGAARVSAGSDGHSSITVHLQPQGRAVTAWPVDRSIKVDERNAQRAREALEVERANMMQEEEDDADWDEGESGEEAEGEDEAEDRVVASICHVVLAVFLVPCIYLSFAVAFA